MAIAPSATVPLPRRAAGHFSCLPKKSNQKNGTRNIRTPTSLREPGEPALLTCSGSRRHGVPAVTALDWPSMASRPTARAALLGADVTGGTATSKARTNARSAFVKEIPLFGPLRKRRVGCRAQRGARQDVEQASSGQGRPVDASPEHGAPPGDRSRSERRGRRGVLSFGDFSLDKQRKVTRRRGAAEPVSARPKVARPSTPYRNKPDRTPNAWARCALPTLRDDQQFIGTPRGKWRP